MRQHVPPAARATFGPGLRLPARAHPTERAVAVLQWPETVATAVQYAWPDHPDWPASGHRGARQGRHQRRLAAPDAVDAGPGDAGRRGRAAP